MLGKFPNTYKLSNTLCNNPWVNEEISRNTKNYFEVNKYMSKFVGTAETALRRTFIALRAYIRKEGRSKEMTKVITFSNKKKSNQMNKLSRKKKIIRSRNQRNENK